MGLFALRMATPLRGAGRHARWHAMRVVRRDLGAFKQDRCLPGPSPLLAVEEACGKKAVEAGETFEGVAGESAQAAFGRDPGWIGGDF